MVLNPEYSVDIIVLVKCQNKYSWYLSDKEFWVLDYNKWASKFGSDEKMSENNPRNGFSVLDSDNWALFENVIVDNLVTRNQLKEMILMNLPLLSWDEKGHLFPSLFINFDTKELFSVFPEYLAFENFIPENWVGKFDDFYSLIPDLEKYWIIDGVDYLPSS